MFGGTGIFAQDVMFGLFADETLCFNVDDSTRARYEAEGMTPFSCQAKGRPITLSYWQVPERLFEDGDEMLAWAETALGVALNARR